MKRTGKQVSQIIVGLGLTLGLLAQIPSAWATPEFTAEVDRESISADESVALKLNVKLDGSGDLDDTPAFSAPEFELINDYTSTYVESFYENGRFGSRKTLQFVKVLRPKKTGDLTISQLTARVDGKVYTAPAITIEVSAGGSGTPPPRNYGGSGVGLRGSTKKPVASGPGFFVRAEVDKSQAFRGEQIIVSYYLYRRTRVFNISVEKYPVLNAFLREDLDMPVLGQRLDTEQVMLDGAVYERSLLTKYAAYPLKEGKLPIDPMSIKASYFPAGQNQEEGDVFQQFFQQMNPREARSTSDPLSVEVAPLPEPKPASFSGGIGTFEGTLSVDKAQAKTNEAITVTFRIEGRGNLNAIEQPKPEWPKGFDLFESKGTTQGGGKGGSGARVFEYLLVPRKPGKFDLPAIEFSYFDPKRREYVSKRTGQVLVEISGEASPDSENAKPSFFGKTSDESKSTGGASGSSIADLQWNGFSEKSPVRQKLLQLATGLGVLLLLIGGFLGGRVGLSRLRLYRQSRLNRADIQNAKTWHELKQKAQLASTGQLATPELFQAYDQLIAHLYRSLDQAYAIPGGTKSYPRAELKTLLVDDQGFPEPIWAKFSSLVEYSETVRFASKIGAASESEARTELKRWVKEGQGIQEAIERRAKKNRENEEAETTDQA